MAATEIFKLEVLSPGRKFFEGEVESLIVPGMDGYIGILAEHLPEVIALNSGIIKIKQNGNWKEAAIHGGFIQVDRRHSIIMSDAAEWPEEIDVNRALAAKERAEERLHQKLDQLEYIRSQAALARALARLKVTQTIK